MGGRTLEHYWTSQSEEHREPHQLVPLEVVGSTLENQKRGIFNVILVKSNILQRFKSKAALWEKKVSSESYLITPALERNQDTTT